MKDKEENKQDLKPKAPERFDQTKSREEQWAIAGKKVEDKTKESKA